MEEMMKIMVMGEEKEIEKGTTYEELAQKFQHQFQCRIIVAKQDNRFRELMSPIQQKGDIEFFDLTDLDGMRVYTRGVCFLMVKVVKELLGEKALVVIEHSIHKSYYCEIREPGFAMNQEFLDQVNARMQEVVAEDLPIQKWTFSRERVSELLDRFNMQDKKRLLRYRRPSTVNIYELDGFYDYFYGYMPPSTGYLKEFDLMLYENGFLIRFPNRKNPKEILPFTDPAKISGVFMEQMKWCSLMGVDNVADLNEVISNEKFGDLVRINEALHEKKIAEIADMIYQRTENVKVVLIAGPSSSGKTTFANRLCVQLRVMGVMPHTISLDDYFVNRDEIPLDELGKKDFESIERLDLKQFNSDLKRLIQGELVELPFYNFITGKREYNGNFHQLKKGEIFVIEGIHGLNDMLTASIPNKNKFKIFISAMTQLNMDEHNHISTVDSRLIRRIVRDHQFRGRDAAGTLETWCYVTRGEERNIFPFQENADVVFNSATIYELSVLKQYIEPLLFKIDKTMPEYTDAKRLIKFLDYFLGTNADAIPNNSIIREFVGGSCFQV